MARCSAFLLWMCSYFFGERTCTIPDRHGCFILALVADSHASSFVMLLHLFFLIFFCYCCCVYFIYPDILVFVRSFIHRFALNILCVCVCVSVWPRNFSWVLLLHISVVEHKYGMCVCAYVHGICVWAKSSAGFFSPLNTCSSNVSN